MKFLEVLAHEGEELIAEVVAIEPPIQEAVRANSLTLTLIISGVLLLLVVISALVKHKNELVKMILFGLIVSVVLINTIYLVGSTIYINRQSVTKGPVHWHADFEIWNCGRQVDLKDPEGLSSYIGNPVIHEHNDKKIHIEGALLNLHQAGLSHFFASIGGSMGRQHLSVPTNDGLVTMRNGDFCPDNNPGKLSVFIYKTENGAYWQEKLDDPLNYVLTPSAQVPPGDCVIFEFTSENKSFTDKLCLSYKVAKEKGKIHER